VGRRRILSVTYARWVDGIARYRRVIVGGSIACCVLASLSRGDFESLLDTHAVIASKIALQQAESFPHCLEQAEIRRFHAMMLLDRAAPGDREAAAFGFVRGQSHTLGHAWQSDR